MIVCWLVLPDGSGVLLWQLRQLHGRDLPLIVFVNTDLDELDGIALFAIHGEAAVDQKQAGGEESRISTVFRDRCSGRRSLKIFA